MCKVIYIILGTLCLLLGSIGTIVPILPTVPFLMLSGVCFGKSSVRLENWFKNTKLYKNNLEDFVNGKGMKMKVKVRIMITVTILFSIGFVMMGLKGIVSGCIVLACVWIFHLLYFIYGIKTIPA